MSGPFPVGRPAPCSVVPLFPKIRRKTVEALLPADSETLPQPFPLSPAMLRRLPVFIPLLWLLLACSTAKDYGPDRFFLVEDNRFSSEASRWLAENYKSAAIYRDFATVLLADAVKRNDDYLRLLARDEARRNKLDEQGFQERLDELREKSGFFNEFLLLFHDPSNPKALPKIDEFG